MHVSRSSGPSRIVDIGTGRIHLTEIGAGPPVLLLHGGGPGATGMSNYARNIDALAERFCILVPDMPGYGQSSKGISVDDPFGDLANAMLKLLDVLDIPRLHVVGNSLGGACALRMALQQPDRVARLVLMGPGGIGIADAPPTDGLKRLLTYYLGDGPTFDKLRTFICDDLVHDSSQITESLLRERHAASVEPEVVANPPLRIPVDPVAFRKHDFLLDPRLDALTHPTLVLWGSEDRVNRPTGAMALQQRLRACDVHMFSRTGHWVQWERAAEFNAGVAAFLAEATGV